MYTHKTFRRIALWYRALGNERRLALVEALSRRKMNCVEISKFLGVGMPSASRHIRILHRAGCISGKRVGREVLFHVEQGDEIDRIVRILRQLAKSI